MNIPGYDQNPSPGMKPAAAAPQAAAGGGQQGQGDGLHHHTIDEDEAGGFHSVHTFPDGRQEPSDHVDYQDAKAQQDADFGCGPADSGDGEDGAQDGDASFADDGEDSGMDGGMDGMNVAKSYGSKAKH